MESVQVVALLDRLHGAGIRAWVAGGWAVDAVVGRRTRDHGDLDLAVDAAQLDALLALLGEHGFRITVDWLPSRVELTAADGRRVDLHPVAFRTDGSGLQSGLNGPGFEYPADGFTAGSIDGRAVPCLSVALQLRFREGYPPRDVDLHDVVVLRGAAAAPVVGLAAEHTARDEEHDGVS
jgi:lincosamide nucleotidyltransferase A/C/D/E